MILIVPLPVVRPARGTHEVGKKNGLYGLGVQGNGTEREAGHV